VDRSIFKSLKLRNYRLFFVGQVISVMGTWLQITALPWLVYRLTNSALLLGTIGFLSQILILVLSPFAGTFADHFPKKKLLIVTQTLSMVQALTLAWLTLSGRIQVWHIVVLATSLGFINAFDMPARQSFVIEMVSKENLINAIGLNSMIFNSARLVGPSVAGILIAALGEGYCFLINGLSFIAVITALFFIIPLAAAAPEEPGEASITQKFLSGLAYIRQTKAIGAILLLLAITGLIGAFPTILMPVFVRDVYHMGPSGLGLFMSAMGIGALLGTLNIASTTTVRGVEKTIFGSALALGVLVILFAFIHNIPLACLLLALIGYFLVMQMGLSNTLIQLTTPDALRGRVMGFYIMAFMGFAPVGSLVAGSLAHQLSASAAVALGGAASLTAGLLLRRRIFQQS
jgi:MFS family permease